MASKTARQEEEGKRKVGSKNGATGRSDIEHVAIEGMELLGEAT
jgi:hypothetical protein